MNKHAQYALVKALFRQTYISEKVYVRVHQSEPGITITHRSDILQEYLCWERDGTEPSVVEFRDIVAAHGVVSWLSLEAPL